MEGPHPGRSPVQDVLRNHRADTHSHVGGTRRPHPPGGHTWGEKTVIREYTLHLKGVPVLSEISSDPRIPDYGKSLTLRCDVDGCNPGHTPEVIWSEGGTVLRREEQRVTRGRGDVLSCSLTFTPTAENSGRVYTCRVTHRNMEHSSAKNLHLRLP
ncbi:unnamed protein product, partial [Staurois parvus]